jgi:hypothetical protein
MHSWLSTALSPLQVSASASASATAGAASATYNAVPSPSSSLSPSVRAARRDLEYVKQKIHETPWEDLDSSLLCPAGTEACPM